MAGGQSTCLDQLQAEYGSTWDGPSDPANPFNWSPVRKITTGVIFSMSQLVTIMSASMLAAAENKIAQDLQVSAATVQIIFSTYFLGLGLGSFLIAALAEMNGRKSVWVAACLWYILWSSVSPLGRSAALMVVGRFFAGTGGSVGITLVGPVMTDMYGASDRGKSLAVASVLTYLGPALGPLMGGVVTDLVGWQWLFWVTSIVCAIILCVGMVFIRESYAPVLLRRAAAKRGVTNTNTKHIRLLDHFRRPIALLFRRPIVQLLGLVAAVNFGIYALMLSTFARLWMTSYHESAMVSSLHYFAFAIGMTIAAQGGGYAMDTIYRVMQRRAGERHGDDGASPSRPEYRVPFIVPGMLLVPAGLFWYAWTAESSAPWPSVDIGAAVFTVGITVVNQGLMAYQLDEFAQYGASANAATRLLSYIFAFVLPIFAPQLYAVLGDAWGNSLLAFITILLGWPIPWILWVWGERLRALGRAR
ncbi:hypothetical protein ASPZODRAFT_149466 [Penicilliopsis zonata CBS 506.65]|uniref:Major facilitator superfamily (MFS) profile domain-containing protein n=1 Tax=Penicilliopsis zonata CBS 506.65 TaxID=1073090 RepID=A0A1L9SS21_9EURO|nr:hypothetical protein ASPZODRAFT_149466 [Penicilliopsis zonata CBS 506.65]OJJ49999.1 hypothetical protein ASPZODRAFT_149466 [Penicilliopsis zonata CBS 506.65]